ncbi:hypothetical protein [Rufibacter hautae]|uniref:Uncharacterized protein n=1 Tax=Rufibacter hautae TaxID=2595005 RepID=A0A5B6TE77_9BACT|nr:hypothetical protein [Rufibacter hautae]KAA3437540.1 hypothetical protein FOA19_09490 [Rufibacter hautae]
MRGKLRHIVLLVVAFCLLTGSIGVAATHRFCAMLGMSQMEEAGLKSDGSDCCAAEKKSSCPAEVTKVDQQSCCSFSVTYHKLDIPSILKFSKVELLAISPMLTTSFLVPPVATVPVIGSWAFYSDSSPPLAGRELLHRLHTLIV